MKKKTCPTHELENPQNGIDVPSLVGSEPLCGESDLGRHSKLELVIGGLEEGEKLSNHDSNVGLVGKSVGELESSSTNGDVSVSKTVEDDGSMTLNGVGIHSDDLVESVESDVSREREGEERSALASRDERPRRERNARLTGCCYPCFPRTSRVC